MNACMVRNFPYIVNLPEHGASVQLNGTRTRAAFRQESSGLSLVVALPSPLPYTQVSDKGTKGWEGARNGLKGKALPERLKGSSGSPTSGVRHTLLCSNANGRCPLPARRRRQISSRARQRAGTA